MDMFDTLGTLIGVGNRTGFVEKDGTKRAMSRTEKKPKKKEIPRQMKLKKF